LFQVEEKLREMGLELPSVPKPVGSYIPAKRVGNLVFSSGQGPLKDGEFIYTGKVPKDVSIEEGYEASKLTALNALACIKSVIGDLDKIKQVVQVRGWVQSSPGFGEQPEVINGCSDLLITLFGENGRHARSALGTAVLGRNITVEIEVVVEVKD